MRNIFSILSLISASLAWQGCATQPVQQPVLPPEDPVVGLWERDGDAPNTGAPAAIIFEPEHFVLAKGGATPRWNVEAPGFYKINHVGLPVEFYYLADSKTLYLLGYGSNSQEIINIVNRGYPIDRLHETGLLPLITKYKLASKPKRNRTSPEQQPTHRQSPAQ
ncbi:MAG: hypothetical protein LBD01_04710 [Puniceicoccales bacterium]|jgi:hypothetical protein|nr:hypothetical protein [Puniceicoccales bacterium]